MRATPGERGVMASSSAAAIVTASPLSDRPLRSLFQDQNS